MQHKTHIVSDMGPGVPRLGKREALPVRRAQQAQRPSGERAFGQEAAALPPPPPRGGLGVPCHTPRARGAEPPPRPSLGRHVAAMWGLERARAPSTRRIYGQRSNRPSRI